MATRSLTPHRARAVEPDRSASPFPSLYREAGRPFENVFGELGGSREALAGIIAPGIDVVQDGHEGRVAAELPGARDDAIDVSIDSDLLTIRADKRFERDGDKHRRHASERAFGTFQCAVRLPQAVDPDEVRARFDHRVPTVRVPRAEDRKGRRRIAIESGPPPPQGKSESRH